ncbi:MAG: hypothetical protein RIR53_319 [Bacteroidota bacterium]|jgi:putative transposase
MKGDGDGSRRRSRHSRESGNPFRHLGVIRPSPIAHPGPWPGANTDRHGNELSRSDRFVPRWGEMAQSHYTLCYHLVFATKHRRSIIEPSIEKRVWSILWDVCVRLGYHPYAIGGVEDHVHVAVSIPPTVSLSDAICQIKNLSTREIRSAVPRSNGFSWQAGYGLFTFGYRDLDKVVRYIRDQRRRHSR